MMLFLLHRSCSLELLLTDISPTCRNDNPVHASHFDRSPCNPMVSTCANTIKIPLPQHKSKLFTCLKSTGFYSLTFCCPEVHCWQQNFGNKSLWSGTEILRLAKKLLWWVCAAVSLRQVEKLPACSFLCQSCPVYLSHWMLFWRTVF